MAVLKVRRYGDPVLRRRAAPVEAVTAEVRRLVSDMIETMYDEVGIGLAAPQVGISTRLMVVGDEEGRGVQVLVNPVISAQGGKVTAEEGCLSLPGVFAPVTRSEWVTLEAQDLEGRPSPSPPAACGRACSSTRSTTSTACCSSTGWSPWCATASSAGSRRKASPRTAPTARSRCSPLKLLFYGTPAFALPTLEALRRHHDIVTVITQPDRPAHRGQRLTPPPGQDARRWRPACPSCSRRGCAIPEWPERLRALGADLAVVVAFGQILPQAVLDAPARGSINIHGSVLPRYRGAAPIAVGDHPRRDA